MEFFIYEDEEVEQILNYCKYEELKAFTKFIDDVVSLNFLITKIHTMKKMALVDTLTKVLQKDENLLAIAKKLYSSEVSKYLYASVVWEGEEPDTSFVEAKYNYKFVEPRRVSRYGVEETSQKGRFALLHRLTRERTYWDGEIDVLSVTDSMKMLLKVVLPIPDDFNMTSTKEPINTEHIYSNESGILNFIDIIGDMLSNNLVEIGKTGEKPKAKTLKVLKTTTNIDEFYSAKKLDNFAVDMLTRSFYYYHLANTKFKNSQLDSLKDFVQSEFNGKLYFFISRILVSHLNKVRFDHHYTNEIRLFQTLRLIISQFPLDGWVDIDNILKFSKYRSLEFHFEYDSKTNMYWYKDEDGKEFNCEGKEYYTYFFDPIIKGAFFYLASLGLFEIKYNNLESSYISAWDNLKYISFTPLGKYIFGATDSYELPKQSSKSKITTLKFDEFKPIISLQKDDAISKAKLEPFCDNLDDQRLILSHTKIFKDCDGQKALDLKIDAFYKNIEANPPQVFKDFFDEIKQNSNLLTKDLDQIVIELKDNKKLLNLFMNNKKIQDIIVKAQGYRVIVLKSNLAKLTKLVKENGFFVEF
ncbi:MAG: hypothetical protein U9P71_05140 [Campylobacterota bacterium]|nr:hypothetical protein [Campylobacterota bacterium]